MAVEWPSSTKAAIEGASGRKAAIEGPRSTKVARLQGGAIEWPGCKEGP